MNFDLKSLTVDHLRKLCTNIGIVNCGSQNKFNCRKAIATYFRYQDTLETSGLKPMSHASRVTSTICRAVNIVFSGEFIEDFKTVNDRKNRKDHETKNTSKAFWIRAALAHNSCIDCDTIHQLPSSESLRDSDNVLGGLSNSTNATADDDKGNDKDNDSTAGSLLLNNSPQQQLQQDSFSSLVFPSDDVYLTDLANDTAINLLCVDQFETDAFRKKIMDLFKIRRKMKENMTISGTHDSDPWNFVECSMSGVTGLTKIAVYYFYQRYEDNYDIDSNFQPFLDSSIRGDTVSLLDDEDGTEATSTTNSKRAKLERHDSSYVMLQNIIQQGSTMLQHLANATEDRKAAAKERKAAAEERKIAASDLKKKTKFHARLEVAKALGDKEELRKLREEAKSMDTGEEE